ncbi:helix-turn-helix domain-containing protein [Propionibacterium freudenreichii]|jgi:transposase|uniref:helix-turn-helix domain-containing protein n=1 Tax=Propionibacterium freudenreichii TaxID=1744 RepID=UPI000543BE6D
MSKARLIVLAVTQRQQTQAEVARRYRVSWRWVHELIRRYEQGGWDAIEPRSRRPRSNSAATAEPVRARILALRRVLTDSGLDAGPVTIAWHLEHEHPRAPSTSTIRRILHKADLITPEPKKRPKSSIHRFEADQPNETWQSDFPPQAGGAPTTGRWPTAATSRSSTGSTTTPGYCSPPPPTAASPVG